MIARSSVAGSCRRKIISPDELAVTGRNSTVVAGGENLTSQQPVWLPLLIPECHDRIEARGANGRYQAGGGRHDRDERRHACQRRRIVRADLDEQRLHQPGQHECGGEASDEAGERARQAMRHDATQDRVATGAERQPDSNLSSALRHQIRQRAGGADRRDQQREAREATEQLITACWNC